MSDSTKKHLRSALVTFVSTFLVMLGTEIALHLPTELTVTSISGLILVVIRGAFKAGFEAWLGSNDK